MKTYWDHSEKERAKLTEDEVRNLLDVELMTKGVKKINAPILKLIQKVSIASEIWFEVGGISFKEAETAQKFIALDPRKATYDYGCGYEYQYAEQIEQKIEQKKLYSHQELLNLTTVLKQNKQAKDENDRLLADYDKAYKEQNLILDEVWTDYWKCKDRAYELEKILETNDEYLKMTDNDKELALAFLKKIYSEEDIKEAFEVV